MDNTEQRWLREVEMLLLGREHAYGLIGMHDLGIAERIKVRLKKR
jgi:hypothetical protein